MCPCIHWWYQFLPHHRPIVSVSYKQTWWSKSARKRIARSMMARRVLWAARSWGARAQCVWSQVRSIGWCFYLIFNFPSVGSVLRISASIVLISFLHSPSGCTTSSISFYGRESRVVVSTAPNLCLDFFLKLCLDYWGSRTMNWSWSYGLALYFVCVTL
jgi:hypothetical protein